MFTWFLHKYRDRKENDDAKKTFFRSNNKWDAARDILVNKYKLYVMSYFERKKRQYRYEI